MALVTSGTATLETALFRVPQVVCYYTPIGKVVSFLRRHILTVKFISLVNLIADREVVKELVADTMTVKNMQNELKNIIENEAYRNEMLLGYEYVAERLGPAGAPRHAAREMLRLLKNNFLFLNKRKADAVIARLFYLLSRRLKKERKKI